MYDFFLDVPTLDVPTVQLTLSLPLARFLAHFLYFLIFHFLGISLVFLFYLPSR